MCGAGGPVGMQVPDSIPCLAGTVAARRTRRARVRHVRGQTSLISLPVSTGAGHPGRRKQGELRNEHEWSSPAAASHVERGSGL